MLTRHLIGLTAKVAILVSGACIAESAQASERVLTVRVYGFPKLSSLLLRDSIEDASRLLSPALSAHWIDCTSRRKADCARGVRGSELILRVVPKAFPASSETALGMATARVQVPAAESGEDAAFVFFDRVMALRTHARSLAPMLGQVMAHELVHLLLAQQGHATEGLMRGEWTRDDLNFSESARLRLSDFSIKCIREEVGRRLLAAEEGERLAVVKSAGSK